MTIPTITEYQGLVPDRRTQEASVFTGAAITWTDYQASNLVPDINATVFAMNGVATQVAADADAAQLSAEAAQAAANYQGDWFVGASVLKGQTWTHEGFAWASKVDGAGEPASGSEWLQLPEDSNAIKAILMAQGLSGNYGYFANGFTYSLVGDVCIDADGNIYTYAGSDPLPAAVASGTNPIGDSDYKSIELNVAAFKTVADMKEASFLTVLPGGTRIEWQGYYSQSDGGSNWGVLEKGDSTSLIDDGGLIFIIVNDSVNGVWIEANAKGSFNIAKFGALGSGDETNLIQTALNSGLGELHASYGVEYSFNTLAIPNTVKKFDGRKAVFKPLGTTLPTALETEAPIRIFGNDDLDLKITMDMSNGDRTAILCDAMTNSRLNNVVIYGFTDDTTYNHRGIRLQNQSHSNKIFKPRITGVKNPTQRGLLIDLWGEVGADFGGFFDGLVVSSPAPSYDNEICHGIFIDGSYAINIQAADSNKFHHNYCKGQNHRGVFFGNGSRDNVVSHNHIYEFTSSGVILTYGSSYNTVSHNVFRRRDLSGGGEAAVNVITGSVGNNIYCNDIDSNNNYGVYVATDSSETTVSCNKIRNHYVAGIAVENDFSLTRPTFSLYSRPNYASPTDLNPLYQSWTFNDLVDVALIGNNIYNGYVGRNTAGISISQIKNNDPSIASNTTAIRGLRLKGNVFHSSQNVEKYLSFYETLNDRLTVDEVIDNSFPDGTLQSDFRYYKAAGEQSFIGS